MSFNVQIHSLGRAEFFCPKSQIRVDEVVSDVAFEALPKGIRESVLKSMHARIVTLSDGSKKLYLGLGLKGGMMGDEQRPLVSNLQIGDTNVSDTQVADNIIQAVPPFSYSSVTVQTVRYQFLGEDDVKEAREILIRPTNLEWFKNVVLLIFAQQQQQPCINNGRAVKALLGSQKEEDIEEALKAYRKNYTFRIYISLDCNNFYFETPSNWKSETCVIL